MATAPGYAHVLIPLKLNTLSRPAAVTFGVHPTDPDPVHVANNVYAAFTGTGSIKSVLDANVLIGPVKAYVGQDGTEDASGVGVASSNGTVTQQSQPPNVAILVRKSSSRGGKRGRGRMYLPWVANFTDFDENGQLQATKITSVQTAVNVFFAALSTGGVPMVLLHTPSVPGVAHPTVPGPPNDVTGMTVDPLVATQRRRTGR